MPPFLFLEAKPPFTAYALFVLRRLSPPFTAYALFVLRRLSPPYIMNRVASLLLLLFSY